MAEITIQTNRSQEILDITRQVNAALPTTLSTGVCHLFCPHTTAGITVNENADPDVKHDLLVKLDQLVPTREDFYRHAEGNSAAHLKASMLGFSLALPVRDGRLVLGTWQGVYFCEFDGPRRRHLKIFWQAADS